MTNEAIRDMVISHDKHIDSLSESIRSLIATQKEGNAKIDRLVEEISKQNVLIERVNNMDRELTESFKRVHTRLDKIEDTKDGDGCNALKIQKTVLTDVHNETVGLSTRMKSVEDNLPKKVSWSIVQWIVAIMVGYSISFGTYIVTSIQDLEKTLVEIKSDHRHFKDVTESLIKRVQDNEDLHRDMGVTRENIR